MILAQKTGHILCVRPFLFERFGKPICGAFFLPYNVLRFHRQNPFFIPPYGKNNGCFPLFKSPSRHEQHGVCRRNKEKISLPFHRHIFEKLQRKFRTTKYPKSLFGLPGIFYLFLRRLSSFWARRVPTLWNTCTSKISNITAIIITMYLYL